MSNNFIIASHNRAKVAEINAILRLNGDFAHPYDDYLPQLTFPPESTTSYKKNAGQKACFISCLLPGKLVLADDSGLELAAYPQLFGVQTARELTNYQHGHEQNQHLIDLVAGRDRHFTMKTVVALAVDGDLQKEAVGQLQGQIAPNECGKYSTGFDRILVPAGQAQTLAQMPFKKRCCYLHRARAVRSLLAKLKEEQDN